MSPMRSADITWLGHSTFLLQTPGGKRVLLEAWVDSCPTCPDAYHGAGLGNLDLILVSHGHGDHIADAAAHAQRTGATVAGMVELMGWLGTQGIDESQLVAFNKGGTIELHGLRVTMVDAKHSSSTDDGTYAGEAAGFVIELEDGFRIYFAGDTCVFGDMSLIADLYSPDLAMLPIGGYYTMDPQQAAMAVELLGVNEVIGMHYGTFPPLEGRPAHLRELLGDSSIVVHEIEVGGTLARVEKVSADA